MNQAHGSGAETAPAAQRQLLQRYYGAVYRYLLGAVRDENAAWDLAQEFAVRFVRGDFRKADPGRGRFRNYVKKALSNLVTDYRRAQRRQPGPLPADVADPAPDETAPDDEPDFVGNWREELINRTWQALAEASPALHAVLLQHVQQPGASALSMVESLSKQLGKTISPGHLRVLLHRARRKFAELIRAEVQHSLQSPGEEELAQELRALDLLKFL